MCVCSVFVAACVEREEKVAVRVAACVCVWGADDVCRTALLAASFKTSNS